MELIVRMVAVAAEIVLVFKIIVAVVEGVRSVENTPFAGSVTGLFPIVTI